MSYIYRIKKLIEYKSLLFLSGFLLMSATMMMLLVFLTGIVSFFVYTGIPIGILIYVNLKLLSLYSDVLPEKQRYSYELVFAEPFAICTYVFGFLSLFYSLTFFWSKNIFTWAIEIIIFLAFWALGYILLNLSLGKILRRLLKRARKEARPIYKASAVLYISPVFGLLFFLFNIFAFVIMISLISLLTIYASFLLNLLSKIFHD